MESRSAPLSTATRGVEAPSEGWLELGTPWLVRLRWAALLVEGVALVVAALAFDEPIPWVPIAGLLAIAAASNAALSRARAHPTVWLPGVVVLDVALLTALIALTGGPMNPFSVFYVVYVALAGLLLEARRAWLVAGVSIVAFALLFVLQPEQAHNHAMHHGMHHDHGWSPHLVGMWVAYVLAAGFIAHFVGRLSSALRAREARLAEVAQMAAQNERLASLSSFSANAAHELGTPLGTIALAAGELKAALGASDPGGPLAADAELVCCEVARCRGILSDLSARAGETTGEMPARTTPGAVIAASLELLAPAMRASVEVVWGAPEAAEAACLLTVRTLAQMVANLIRNAAEACEDAPARDPVQLRIDCRGTTLDLTVLDRGPGLPKPVAERLGEPFVTTRQDRGGLGLGLYLAATFARRSGGQLSVLPRPGGGTEARLTLPRDAIGGAF
jgi:two-component system sensor histidine kinase RegB